MKELLSGKKKVSLLEKCPRFLRDTVRVCGLYMGTKRSSGQCWWANTSSSIYHTLFGTITCENYEVERQRHNKQVEYTQDSSFFPRNKRGALKKRCGKHCVQWQLVTHKKISHWDRECAVMKGLTRKSIVLKGLKWKTHCSSGNPGRPIYRGHMWCRPTSTRWWGTRNISIVHFWTLAIL